MNIFVIICLFLLNCLWIFLLKINFLQKVVAAFGTLGEWGFFEYFYLFFTVSLICFLLICWSLC